MILENKVALVTGGSSGIGQATAIALAREGAAVAVCDVNIAGGHETVSRIVGAGGKAHFFETNIADESAIARMVAETVKEFGGLHIAVNNAGVSGKLASITEVDTENYDFVMDINVKGVMFSMKYEVPQMLAEGGSIINVASVAGLLGFSRGLIYAASKHAVIGLTRSVALEVAKKGIRVNAVCPSYIDTPMVSQMVETIPSMAEGVQNASPMKRLGKPEEIADVIVWLASSQSSFVNGVAMPIDGGFTAM